MREKLKAARKAAGLTQQQMADRLHITVRHYQRIESGKTLGTFELWDTLEDMFSISQRNLRENSTTNPGTKASQ